MIGIFIGIIAWAIVRYGLTSFYTVNQNERAVKTRFGRAVRIPNASTLDDPVSESLKDYERDRYDYPQLEVIQPGGPYFKLPWEKIHKVNIATVTRNMAYDPEDPMANQGGSILEAVTKDQLDTGLTGQIRFRISERNLYAYIFGVKNPEAHVMGYFVSILRERIANFEAPNAGAGLLQSGNEEDGAGEAGISLDDQEIAGGISINDLRKNLRDINDHMDRECVSSAARYGIELEASLITGIDPPQEVESALAAINTAHNQVSADISLAKAQADQKIVESKRAVEIETLRAQAEVEPLRQLADQFRQLKDQSPQALKAYTRNIRLGLLKKADHVYLESND